MIFGVDSDKEIPSHLRNDPHLWSGCISGTYTEEGFLPDYGKKFSSASFTKVSVRVRLPERSHYPAPP